MGTSCTEPTAVLVADLLVSSDLKHPVLRWVHGASAERPLAPGRHPA